MAYGGKAAEERNIELKRMLLAGNTVAYTNSGRSLEPKIYSGDKYTYEPVKCTYGVLENDIVFCELQDGDRFYVGLVRERWFDEDEHCDDSAIASTRGRFINDRVGYVGPISQGW